jgi:hypothetical protein
MYLNKHFTANSVTLEPFPFQREIAMEAYLIENPGVLSMGTDGFSDVEILLSEQKLINGRGDKKTDGRIDILARYSQEYLAIVELKLGQLTQQHLDQLTSYLNERKQIATQFPEIIDSNLGDPKWIGVMVGNTIDPTLMNKIRSGCYHQDIPIAALTINRFRGEDGSIYIITDTYFIEKVIGKDYTKYLFKGKTYGKGKLVLAVIQDYVENHPDITYSQLKASFPDKLQGTETFTTETEAKAKKSRRNFIKPTELISLKDEIIAVSTEWGKNITKFLDHCKQMGIEINQVNSK